MATNSMDLQKRRMFEEYQSIQEAMLRTPKSDPRLVIKISGMEENEGRLVDYAEDLYNRHQQAKAKSQDLTHIGKEFLWESEEITLENKIENYRKIGYDLALYNLKVMPWMEVGHKQELFGELVREYELNKNIQGKKHSDYFVRKWIQLRLNAVKRGKPFEANITPVFLALVTQSACPITGEFFQVSDGEDAEVTQRHLSFDRVNNDLGYEKNNIIAMSVVANQAKGRLGFAEVLDRAAGRTQDSALTRPQWTRMALLMSGSCSYTDKVVEATNMRIAYFGIEAVVGLGQIADMENYLLLEKISKTSGYFGLLTKDIEIPLTAIKKSKIKILSQRLGVHPLRAEMLLEDAAKEYKARMQKINEHDCRHGHLDMFFASRFDWMSEIAHNNVVNREMLDRQVEAAARRRNTKAQA